MNGNFADLCRLVGLDGLEPSTSRLSGVRSNHLSYKPFIITHLVLVLPSLSACADWWRWWGSNPWPPACRAGALPAELHPRFRVAFAFSKISQALACWSLKIEQQKFHTRFLCRTSSFSSTPTDPWKSVTVSIERRWSSRTFRYGYLVTT